MTSTTERRRGRAPASRQGSLRERKKSRTRREILRAGRRLFSEEGLYDSRIEDITRRAGIAKGTLYLYFPSKEELVRAVVAEGFEELRAHVGRTPPGRDLARRGAEIFRAHQDFFRLHPDLMRILHQVRGVLTFGRAAWRPLRGELARHLEFLARELAVGSARSWSRARRLELAVFLFGSASGVSSVLAATYPGARARNPRWSAALEPLVAALGAGTARRR